MRSRWGPVRHAAVPRVRRRSDDHGVTVIVGSRIPRLRGGPAAAAGIGGALFLVAQRGFRRVMSLALLLALSIVTLRGDWLLAAARWIAAVVHGP